MNTQRRWFLQGAGALIGAQALSGCASRAADDGNTDGVVSAAQFATLRRFRQLSMGNVAYVEYGVGRTVLMLHGFPLNSFQWRDAIARLAPHARCIAPDFLGMGHSAALAGQDLGPA